MEHGVGREPATAWLPGLSAPLGWSGWLLEGPAAVGPKPLAATGSQASPASTCHLSPVSTCAHAVPRPQVYPVGEALAVLEPYSRLPPQGHVARPADVVAGPRHLYTFFPRPHGDMHSLVRRRRRLPEPEAAALFRQMAAALAHCHQHGLVLRDLKLRRFVFTDHQR